MAFLPDRPPHLGGLTRFQHPNDITDSQSGSVTFALCRAIAALGAFRCRAVELDQHRIIKFSPSVRARQGGELPQAARERVASGRLASRWAAKFVFRSRRFTLAARFPHRRSNETYHVPWNLLTMIPSRGSSAPAARLGPVFCSTYRCNHNAAAIPIRRMASTSSIQF